MGMGKPVVFPKTGNVSMGMVVDFGTPRHTTYLYLYLWLWDFTGILY